MSEIIRKFIWYQCKLTCHTEFITPSNS